MPIFSFLAKLGLDTTDFQAGVKRAQSSATGLGKGIADGLKRENDSIKGALAGMFTVSAARSYFGDLKNIVGEIKDMSELLGVSTDEVQRLQRAAEGSGQSFKVVVSALQKIEQMRAEALTGDERSTRIFGMLGINPESSPMDIMQKAVKASGGTAQESAAAFELLGRRVGNLKLVIDELANVADARIIPEADIQAMDDNVKKFEAAWNEFVIVGAPLATALVRGLTALLKFWNPESITAFAGIGKNAKAEGLSIGQTLEAASSYLLGTPSEEGKKYAPLEMRAGKTQPTQDQNALILEAARANIKTFEILSRNVDQ
jgi:hypothetical protein